MFSLELGEAQLGNLQNLVEVVVGPRSPDVFPYFRGGFSSSLCIYLFMKSWSGCRDGVGSLMSLECNPSKSIPKKPDGDQGL